MYHVLGTAIDYPMIHLSYSVRVWRQEDDIDVIMVKSLSIFYDWDVKFILAYIWNIYSCKDNFIIEKYIIVGRKKNVIFMVDLLY